MIEYTVCGMVVAAIAGRPMECIMVDVLQKTVKYGSWVGAAKGCNFSHGVFDAITSFRHAS